MYMQQLSQKIVIQIIGCVYMLSFTFWLESKNLNFKDSALTPKFHFDYIVQLRRPLKLRRDHTVDLPLWRREGDLGEGRIIINRKFHKHYHNDVSPVTSWICS